MSEETDTVQPMVSAPSSDSQKGPSRTTVQSSFASYFISGTSPYLNILLVFTVLNPILYYVDESTNLVFISGVISITILADRIRFILQQIDEIVPAWLNNVLDTLFNNSPEFCLAFYALDRNQEALVKYFLLGQIMSNLSLVLGVSFMVGGFFRDVNKFHTKILNSSSIILFVGLTPMLFSTIQGVSYELTSTAGKNEVARGTSFIMLSTYIMYLVFQSITHTDYFTGKPIAKEVASSPTALPPSSAGGNAARDEALSAFEAQSDNNDTYQKQEMEIYGAMVMLAVSLVLLTVACDSVTWTISDFASSLNVKNSLMGAVLLPVFTNIVEYITAMTFVAQNKADLCVNSAYDSAITILLFLYPVVQLFSWYTGDDITYGIGSFSICALALTILVCTVALSGGNANWVVGAGIFGSYLAVALGYAVHT